MPALDAPAQLERAAQEPGAGRVAGLEELAEERDAPAGLALVDHAPERQAVPDREGDDGERGGDGLDLGDDGSGHLDHEPARRHEPRVDGRGDEGAALADGARVDVACEARGDGGVRRGGER